jgi:hypothetical protein
MDQDLSFVVKTNVSVADYQNGLLYQQPEVNQLNSRGAGAWACWASLLSCKEPSAY